MAASEICEFVNTTKDEHHAPARSLVSGALDRRQQLTSEIVFTDRAIDAKPEERGWKDTILCPPAEVTRIITPFVGEPGRFAWHCHMLEHEDNKMMRPYILRSR
jgi:spore coat protein A